MKIFSPYLLLNILKVKTWICNSNVNMLREQNKRFRMYGRILETLKKIVNVVEVNNHSQIFDLNVFFFEVMLMNIWINLAFIHIYR